MKKFITSVSTAMLLFAINAEATPLYTKCIPCHGEQGEKVALNKSLVIKDMSNEAFVTALKGYKDGTYGKEMKAMMKAQVIPLNEDQMKELANSIVKK